jgi:hypothetical protein
MTNATATESKTALKWQASSPPTIAGYPKLDDKQVGHVRHIHNLIDQLDYDWSGMSTAKPGQELTDSYRYQLTQMAYALGFAHFHHLPAAAGAFRPTFERLIHKMQLRDVWDSWYETSRGGNLLDPDMTELRAPWRDPIVKENIMYSGRLFAVLGMHSMLFDSDKYDEPGAISLRYEPILHGMGPEIYEYSTSSISDIIYWQMVESGFLGVVCEPNALFVVCNQFPILAWKFLDIRRGTSRADEVTRAYSDAWEKRGMLDPNGDYWRFWMVKQETPVQLLGGAASHWTAINLNAWNRELVHELYETQTPDYIRRTPDGLLTVAEPTAMVEARTARRENRVPAFERDTSYRWTQSEFGYTAACMAEMGDQDNLRDMLAYADKYLQPTWRNGGLSYPRNDTSFDEQGNYVYMDALTGNGMLAYARLNVPDGLWKMYTHPWTSAHFAQPHVSNLTGRVDILRACYDESQRLLALTYRPVDSTPVDIRMTIANVKPGQPWTLFQDGILVAMSDGAGCETRDGAASKAEHIEAELVVTCPIARETDFALVLHES